MSAHRTQDSRHPGLHSAHGSSPPGYAEWEQSVAITSLHRGLESLTITSLDVDTLELDRGQVLVSVMITCPPTSPLALDCNLPGVIKKINCSCVVFVISNL